MSAACKWLDVAKAIQRIETDYRLAKVLGINTSRIAGYRSGAIIGMDDELAIKVAELARVEPLKVLAELAADRSKSDSARAYWNAVANGSKHAA